MFPSYKGAPSRSISTTDIYRTTKDLTGPPRPPVNNHSSQVYKSPTSIPIFNRRRRIAPIPPQRTDSNNAYSIDPDPEASVQKRVKSFLTQENEADAIVLPTQLTQNPSTRNFVKKLVETLEKRQKEQRSGFGARIGALLGNGDFVQRRNVRNTIPQTRVQETQRNQSFENRLHTEQIISRFPTTQLEDLVEDDEDDWSDSNELAWDNEKETPIRIIERKTGVDDNEKPTTVKRTIKNMFSSMLNWKTAKGLPKGSREYYAARESLGEEMRAFRRDHMPRLMERASVKGKLADRKRTEPHQGPIRADHQREFSELIRRPKHCERFRDETSIATIRPVYGSTNSQRRSWHNLEFPQDVGEKLEVVYGSIKVQPPAPPPRTIPEPHQPLHPSRVKDLQKRISRHESYYSQVQLRKPLGGAAAPSFYDNNIDNRNSIIYDVPRSKPLRVAPPGLDNTVRVEHININRITPPEYANVSGIIGAHDDDKRLHCTAFTTF